MDSILLRQIIAVLATLSGIAIAGLVIISAETGVLFPFAWTADYTLKHYGVTIDAGSHGTRGHLFSWPARVENPDHPLLSPVTIPTEEYQFDAPAARGIAGFMSDPKDVGPEVLKPIVDEMVTRLTDRGIDVDEIHTIPIFLKATAGMRNMDVDSRDAIMTSIRVWLENETNSPFHFQPDWARVISGEEEGVFGWITVNQMQNSLLSPANGTTGALDLGGASAQITFMPTHTSVLEGFYALNLGPETIRLYSHSFLGYGWGDALSRVTTRLALEHLFMAFREDPLLNTSAGVHTRSEITAGSVPKIRLAKQKKSAGSTLKTPPLAEFDAHHPCFPSGYKFKFDIPSLIYPDGRAFLDMDLRAILAYMEALGININSDVVRRNFPLGVIEQVKSSPLTGVSFKPIMEHLLKGAARKHSIAIESPARTLQELEELDDFGDIAISDDEAEPFHPFAEPLPADEIVYRVIFTGSGDFRTCQKRAQELFYREPCFLSTCSFNGVYQPRIAESRFLALGQYAKVRSALDIPLSATPNTLERKTAELCQLPWAEIQTRQGAGRFKPYGKKGVAKLCWKSTWAHATLTAGYGLDGESKAVTFYDFPVDTPENAIVSPGWALGSMLAEVSFFPWQNSRGRYEAVYFWALASTILLLCLAVAQHIKIRKLIKKRETFGALRSDVYHDLLESPAN